MDKEEVLLKVKGLGFKLEHKIITLKEYNEKVTYLIRYKWNK